MRTISDIGFEQDGTVLVTYLDTEDVRCQGRVALRHTIRIEPDSQFHDGIQRIADVVWDLVAEAEQAWAESSPVSVPERALGEQPEPDELGEQLDAIRPERPLRGDDAVAARNWEAIQASRAPLNADHQ